MSNKILDPAKNFAIATVSGSYTTTNTTIYVQNDAGTLFPDPTTDGNFNINWWNYTDYKNPSDDPNVEIARCTGRTTNSFTITRPSSTNSYHFEGSDNTAQTHSGSEKIYKVSLIWSKRNADYVDDFLDGTAMHSTNSTSAETNSTDGYVIEVSDGITSYRPGQIYTFNPVIYSSTTNVLDLCETAWTSGHANVSCSTSTNSKEGTYSALIDASSGVIATGCEIAYKTLSEIQDISNHSYIFLWAYLTVNMTYSGDLRLRLYQSTTLKDTIYFPLMNANTWYLMAFELSDPSQCSSITQLKIYHSALYSRVGNFKLYLDEIIAPPSLDINDIGPKRILGSVGDYLSIGDIRTEKTASVLYSNNDDFLLINQPKYNVGDIKIITTSNAPTGWVLCNGASYSTSIYPELYSVLGTTYGTGGDGTFNVPDLQSRVPVGRKILGSSQMQTLGGTGGAERVTLTEDEMPTHSGHVTWYSTLSRGSTGANVVYQMTTADKGSSDSHENMPPFIVLNYAIKT